MSDEDGRSTEGREARTGRRFAGPRADWHVTRSARRDILFGRDSVVLVGGEAKHVSDGQHAVTASSDPLCLTIAPGRVPWRKLSAVLQCGAGWRLQREQSIRSFLAVELAIDAGYIESQIATVILDGMVVDDLDAAMVRPGSRLTLSAAMPGLVGATLRRGGYYRAMRSEISWDRREASPEARGDRVTLKLFNTVLRDLGPALLARGVIVPAATARDLLDGDSAVLPGLPFDGEVEVRVAAGELAK